MKSEADALSTAAAFINEMAAWETKWGPIAIKTPLDFASRSSEVEKEMADIFQRYLSNALLSKRQSRLDLLMPSSPPEYQINAIKAILDPSGKRATVITDSITPFSPAELSMALENGKWKISGKTSIFEDKTRRTTKWM